MIQSALWIDREGVTDAELQQRFPVSGEDLQAARALLRGLHVSPAPSAPPPPAPVAPGSSPPPRAVTAPASPRVATAPSAGATEGKVAGPELAGSGVGGGSTGDRVVTYYLTLVDRKIQESWLAVGSVGQPERVVVVRFRVLRSGQVRDLEVESGSGLQSFDEAALRAVRQSLPLPPFPNLLTEPSLDLRYRFVAERR